jgi:hypothetical protein
MKRIITRIDLLAFALLLAIGAIGFADENTVNLQSVVLKTFDATEENFDQWVVIGSRFSAPAPEEGQEPYPRIKFFNNWPISLHGTNPKEKENLRVLGVAMMFTRQEYNWVDIVPGTKETVDGKLIVKPTEIPMPGRVKQIDMWVWSPNMNYYIEAYVRDYTGIVHTIPLGELNYVGWRNLTANIPTGIPQSKKYLPYREGLTFVKFRIWARPAEVAALPSSTGEASPITFYFDQIKIMTDTFETLFDGDDLATEEVENAWNE